MNRQAHLVPVSHAGYDRLMQHGEVWNILRTHEGMILVESLKETYLAWNPDMPGGYELKKDTRWVDLKWDQDFDVHIVPKEVAV